MVLRPFSGGKLHADFVPMIDFLTKAGAGGIAIVMTFLFLRDRKNNLRESLTVFSDSIVRFNDGLKDHRTETTTMVNGIMSRMAEDRAITNTALAEHRHETQTMVDGMMTRLAEERASTNAALKEIQYSVGVTSREQTKTSIQLTSVISSLRDTVDELKGNKRQPPLNITTEVTVEKS